MKKRNINNKKNLNAYDKQSKRILKDKDVLSFIMKECIPEYRECTIEEIKKCIEDGNDYKFIQGIRNEDSRIKDTTVVYDILFTSKLPNSNEEIGMYINVEAQNNSTRYPLINRAIYYVSRIISGQKQEVFDHTHYENIKKVYSIWICINPSKQESDTINYYTLSEQCIKGNYHIKKDYKLINIIMLNVGKDYDYNDNKKGILEMLSLLFTYTGLEAKEITKILNNDYGIIKKEEEVSKMCSLSGSILAQGIEQGIEQGIVKTIINMINSGIPIEEAFSISKASDNVKEIVMKIQKNKK